MEESKLESALTEMEARMAQLENTIAVLTYQIQCVMDEARKWNGPDLFTKDG